MIKQLFKNGVDAMKIMLIIAIGFIIVGLLGYWITKESGFLMIHILGVFAVPILIKRLFFYGAGTILCDVTAESIGKAETSILNDYSNVIKDLSDPNPQKKQKAIDYCTKVIKLAPAEQATAGAYYFRGVAYMQLNKYADAVKDFSKAIKLDSDNIETLQVYRYRGGAYFYLENYVSAIEDCTKALELDPENAEIYNIRGAAYFQLEEYTRAVRDYTKSIKLKPDDAYIYTNRGHTYYELEEYDNAIKDYTKALKLNPDDEDACSSLKDVQAEKRKPKK